MYTESALAQQIVGVAVLVLAVLLGVYSIATPFENPGWFIPTDIFRWIAGAVAIGLAPWGWEEYQGGRSHPSRR